MIDFSLNKKESEMFARASCSCLVFPSSYGVATSWERGEGPHRHSQTMFSVSAIPPPLLPLPVPRTWSCCCQLEKLPPIYFPHTYTYLRSFSNFNRLVFLSFMENLFLANAMPIHAANERGFFFAPPDHCHHLWLMPLPPPLLLLWKFSHCAHTL